MLDIFIERLRQKDRTVPFPAVAPVLSPRFRGRPVLDGERWKALTKTTRKEHLSLCPTRALGEDSDDLFLDMGLCTFCGVCARQCAAGQGRDAGVVEFTSDWRLGATRREDLVIRPGMNDAPPITPTTLVDGAFRRSLRLRQVSAAGCGACEADLNVLSTIVFDIGRFGIDFVASPRHADAMVLTGPVPRNMREAVHKCETAMPVPKILMAVGACAISGGLFRSLPGDDAKKVISTTMPATPQNAEGMPPHYTPDLYIPGCPPHPYTTLDAWLRFLGLETPIPPQG